MNGEYSINRLAQLAGVSTRTLRYYDEIGLLTPGGKTPSGYRVYSQKEVDILHQIMFYKQSGMQLEDIKRIITSPDFDPLTAMQQHLEKLVLKKEKLEELIENADKTIRMLKGEQKMSNKEKFDAFKQNMVKENEEKYGREIREKYGDEKVDATNQKILGMTEEEYTTVEELNAALNETLKAAVAEGNPASETAQKACRLHKKWLSFYWNFYTKEAHLGLCLMYTQDERFKSYYENIAPDCAEFLYEAMKIYLA